MKIEAFRMHAKSFNLGLFSYEPYQLQCTHVLLIWKSLPGIFVPTEAREFMIYRVLCSARSNVTKWKRDTAAVKFVLFEKGMHYVPKHCGYDRE